MLKINKMRVLEFILKFEKLFCPQKKILEFGISII
jgi:hypothetical protein